MGEFGPMGTDRNLWDAQCASASPVLVELSILVIGEPTEITASTIRPDIRRVFLPYSHARTGKFRLRCTGRFPVILIGFLLKLRRANCEEKQIS
jgi:hypothetical protein